MQNQMAMLQQLMKTPNKMGMIENMIQQNPQLANAWKTAQQLSQSGNKDEILSQLATQKGMTVDEIKEMAKQYGINI